MSSTEATAPTTEVPVTEEATKVEEAAPAPVAEAVEAPKEEAATEAAKPVEEAAPAATEEAKPVEEAKEAAPTTPKKEKKQSPINKFFGLFNKKEKSPKKEVKSDAAEPAKVEEAAAPAAEPKAEEAAAAPAPVVEEAKPEAAKVEEAAKPEETAAAPAEEAKPAEEGVKIDEAAKKEDAATPTASQKEKLSRRLSARVGNMFNKPKKEVAAAAESKPAEVTNEKVEDAPKAPEAATPVVATA